MTAARHARPAPARTAPRTLLAVAVVLAVAAAFWATRGLPANTAPAVPWHYLCTEHLQHLGRVAAEWFTPNSLLMRGDCLQ